jgi:uncharacterized protein YlxW (UPF0749 family)
MATSSPMADDAAALPAGRTARLTAGAAVDASMDLLNQILRQPIDPDYAIAAAQGGRSPRRWRWSFAIVTLTIGALLAIAVLQTTQAAPALLDERAGLIDRIKAAETNQDQLRGRVTSLSAEIALLREAVIGDDATSKALVAQISRLGPAVSDTAVTGPGVLIAVDDAPGGNGEARNRVLDLDLQILANGLWQAGAEAVAINGHRLSSLTAIRSAGDAITVDYRSLNRPYRIEAIGDSRTLQARFVESSGGAWWNELAENQRMRYEISTVDAIALPADPGIVLRYARQPKS